MVKIMPKDIVTDVEYVLKKIKVKNQKVNPFVTAYQILEQLHKPIKQRLIKERGHVGKKSGVSYSAASVVSDAAEMIRPKIDIQCLNTSGLKIFCAGKNIIPGNPNVGLYRLNKK